MGRYDGSPRRRPPHLRFLNQFGGQGIGNAPRFYQGIARKFIIIIFKYGSVMVLRECGIAPPLSRADVAARPLGVCAARLESVDIVSGAEAVKKAGNLHGFPECHIDAMMAFVTKHNVVIAFRPVNPLATSLIEAGYPTKPLEIKGKSGGLGLIPVDQNLSKAYGDPEKVKKLNAAVAQCIKDGHAKAITYPLTAERLSELEQHGAIKVLKGKHSKNISIVTENGPTYQGILISEDKAPPIYKIKHGGKKVFFLGKVDEPAMYMPFTADYDLLLFAPRIQDYGPQDMPRLGGRRRTCSSVYERIDTKHAGLVKLVRRNSTSSVEDLGDPGVISSRLQDLLPKMNQALGREPGNALIHHGADTSNPFTVTSDNIPCIFFFPDNAGGQGSVAVAKNEKGLQTLLQKTKDEKFQFFSNDKWEKALHPKRASLTESRARFSPKSSSGNNVDLKENNHHGPTAITRADQSTRAETLTANAAVPHEKDGRRDSDLMRAAEDGDIAAVRNLLADGVDVNEKNSSGVNALMRAAEGAKGAKVRHFVVAQILIDNGAKVNERDNNGATALMYAARSGQVVTTQVLLANRAGADAIDKDGNTALTLAASNGQTATVQVLLEPRAYIEAKNKDGATALMLAAHNGHNTTVRALVRHGAKIKTETMDRHPDKLRAARNGDVIAVKALTTNAAVPHEKDSRRDSGLMRAAEDGDIAAVKELLADGADVNEKNSSGVNALMRAAEGAKDTKGTRVDHFVIVQLLIDSGARVNERDNNGTTALMYAARNGQVVATKVLLANRARANEKDKDGNTALTLAASNGQTATVQVLLQPRADIEAENKDGNTALMLAAHNGHNATVRALVRHGAKIKTKTMDRHPDKLRAAWSGNVVTVKELAAKVDPRIYSRA